MLNLPPLPNSIALLIQSTKPPINSRAPIVDLDHPEAVERAIAWLRNSSPEAIENSQGNTTTFKIACRVKDFGISELMIAELLRDYWNEIKASPMWEWEDLVQFARSAYKSGQNAPGSASAHADFSPVEMLTPDHGQHRGGPSEDTESPNQTARRGLFAIGFEDAIKLSLTETAEPLIQGVLDCGAMSVIYGESNSGKTFLALDIAAHIGAGKNWNGRKTKSGLVIYIAAEGGRGIYKRLNAWRRYHDVDPTNVDLALIPCPVDLRSMQGDTEPLIALIRREEAARGRRAVLVVIDTLSRALSGGDENSPIDMGLLVRNCDRIREAIGCHCSVIHHTGKNKAAGARGHSLLRAATDTEIEIDNKTVVTKKQRDIEPAPPIRFDLRRIDLGTDANGDAVSSCTVELRTASEFERLPLDPQSEQMLEAVRRAAKETAERRGVTAAWKSTPVSSALCDKHYREINSETGVAAIAATPHGATDRRLRKLRQNLVEYRFLKKGPRKQWLLM